MRTPDFFGKLRKKRAHLMHVSDAGCSGVIRAGDKDDLIVEYTCRRCGHCSGWLKMETITKSKRGVPCPICNAPEVEKPIQ